MSTPHTPDLEPVSALLERKVRAATRLGLHVWADAPGDYVGFVDSLAARTPGFPVVAWRTSFVEAMLALGDIGGGTDDRPALLHVPHHDGASIVHTPLYEAYASGKPFAIDLHTLVEEAAAGLVTPSDIQAFLAGPDVSLARADAWLAEHAIVAQGGVEARIVSRPPELLVLLFHDRDPELIGALKSGAMSEEHLWGHLHRALGLDSRWRDFAHSEPSGVDQRDDHGARCQAIGLTAIYWCLCVEYVHDLTRAPIVEQLKPLTDLSAPLVATARAVAASLRDHRPDLYESVVDEFEPRIDIESKSGSARDLGEVDTFRFEQRKIMEESLDALGKGDFAIVEEWAHARRAERSFWVRRDQARDAAWRLVAHAARLGALLEAYPAPLAGAMSLPEAVELYVELGAPVDRAHRTLEQRRSSLLDTRLPLWSTLRLQLDGLRARYRAWADAMARAFNALCVAHGFRPTESLQQRHVFDQEVREQALALSPSDDPPVAFFMVDALRFEMAQELMEDLSEEPGVELTLKPRLAELPTITAVGMNALAPITQNGLLHPILKDGAFMGFKAREFQITRPADRQRAMKHRVGGRTCPEVHLREILDDDVTRLRKRIGEAALLIVKSSELDESGEKGLGPATFETTLRDLRSAVGLLRDAGVEHFVFSADHGFLLLDPTAMSEAIKHGGKQTGIDRRHLVYPANVVEDGRVTVSLRALGYAGQDGYLVLPEDTSIFDRGARNGLFVHGGNAPQERVIPVLRAHFKNPSGGNLLRFELTAARAEGVMGLHAVRVTVRQNNAQGALAFAGADHLDLAIRPFTPDADHAPRVEVELADVRGGELRGGVVRAPVGAQVEIFFKLSAHAEVPKIEIEVYSPARRRDEVAPARLEPEPPALSPARYSVTQKSHPNEPTSNPNEDATSEAPEVTSEAAPTPPTPADHGEVVEVVDEANEANQQDEADEPAGLGDETSELIAYGGWEELPRDGTQQIFEHIAQHGFVTEEEARKMLGGSGRQLRRFARKIDEYISHVSFDVRIEMAGGTKRYVLEKS